MFIIWNHITDIFYEDRKVSLRIMPKIALNWHNTLSQMSNLLQKFWVYHLVRFYQHMVHLVLLVLQNFAYWWIYSLISWIWKMSIHISLKENPIQIHLVPSLIHVFSGYDRYSCNISKNGCIQLRNGRVTLAKKIGKKCLCYGKFMWV